MHPFSILEMEWGISWSGFIEGLSLVGKRDSMINYKNTHWGLWVPKGKNMYSSTSSFVLHLLWDFSTSNKSSGYFSLLALRILDHSFQYSVPYIVSLLRSMATSPNFDPSLLLDLEAGPMFTLRLQLTCLDFETCHLAHLVTHSWIFHSRLPLSLFLDPHHSNSVTKVCW